MVKLICILGFTFWCTALTVKYYYFGFYDWDFALYSQTMWALCHGTTFASLFGTSFLADHAHFIAFLLTPVYFIFHDPLILVYLEVLSFFTGAYIFYKLAEKLTSKNTAFVLMMIYIFHPANIFMLMYEFHFESLAVGLIFLLFYFKHMEHYRAFIVTALLLMLIKENMPVIVFMVGVHGLLFKPAGRTKWGLVPLLLGLSTFILTVFVIMPMVRQNLPTHQNIYWGLYSSFGSTPGGIMKNLLFHPGIFIKHVGTLKNLYFIRDILGGFTLGALFCPSILLIGTPLFLQILLSSAATLHTIFFHYTATLVPFVAIAAAYGFVFFKKKCTHRLYLLFLVLSLLIAGYNLIGYLPSLQNRIQLCMDQRAEELQAIVNEIPSDAGVVASPIFLSHLSQRKNLYSLYNVWMGINYFTGQKPFIVPSTVHYALIDLHEPFLSSYLKFPDVKLRINRFITQGGWKIKYARSGIEMLER